MSLEESTQSNKFLWKTYETPCLKSHDGKEDVDEEQDEQKNTEVFHNDDALLVEEEGQSSPDFHTFTIRHLKQGATGARKTWPASEMLLNHLLSEGGPLQREGGPLRRDDGNDQESSGSKSSTEEKISSSDDHHNNNDHYNIMELGAGSGRLAIGLATALNHEAKSSSDGNRSFQPRAKIMCTDIDKATIKNLRHNIARQPKDRNMSKAIRVASLGWGNDVGGAAFDRALMDQFSTKERTHVPSGKSTKKFLPPPAVAPHENASADIDDKKDQKDEDTKQDPLRLLTHVIGSDVLYGVAALEPLSECVSSIKLRNPGIKVILMLRELASKTVTDLKDSIEDKVSQGLTLRLGDGPQYLNNFPPDSPLGELQNLSQTFSVNLRDVAHTVDNTHLKFKLIEC